MTASALYVGDVLHRRTRPRAHRLRYRIWSLLLDLDELDAVAARLRWLSRNRFNLLSFHDRDFGDGSATPLREQAERQLAAAGLDFPLGAVRLLAMPRVLGFGFNPLTVWYCHDDAGRLRALIHEVHNTFGERHSYALPVAADADDVRQHCAKRFHVSPFLPMAMDYAFRLTPPGERLAIAITASDADGPVLFASQTATARPLTDAALARVFVTHPLLTFKVVAGILWEALRLLAKRVPVFTHPGRRRAAGGAGDGA
ncbi:MAG: DUF1365 family protein [Sphingomonadales bacterium]|nr:DUF1365 family protein [Sphingomonadales bacterium]